MRKLVIFDLDGTLLYTLEDLLNSLNYTLDLFCYKKCTLKQISAYVGNGVRYLLEKAVGGNIGNDQLQVLYECFTEYYSQHCCEKSRPYDGIMEMLKEIKSKGIKVGIVSNKYQQAAEEVCEHYFNGLYDIVVGESETCRRKPAPDGINFICEKYGIPQNEVLFFGDSEVDIETARNSGVFCASVLWGYRTQTELSDAGANVFINNPSQISGILSEDNL